VRTEMEIKKQINDVEQDITLMSCTAAQVAWEYYVKALRWVLGERETMKDEKHAETIGVRYQATILK